MMMNGQSGIARNAKVTKPTAPASRTGLSVQELKAMTSMRMNHSQDLNSPRIVVGAPPIAVVPSPTVLQAPVLAVNSGGRVVHARPVVVGSRDMTEFAIPGAQLASNGYIPIQKVPVPIVDNKAPAHALTVQELKELTRMRLAREAAESCAGGNNSVSSGEPSPQQQPLYSARRSNGPTVINLTSGGTDAELEQLYALHNRSQVSHSGTTTPDSGELYMDDVELTVQGMTPVHPDSYQRAQFAATVAAQGRGATVRGASSNLVNSQGFVKASARVPMLNLYQTQGGTGGSIHSRKSPTNCLAEATFAADDHALALRMAQQGRIADRVTMQIRPHSHAGTVMHTPRSLSEYNNAAVSSHPRVPLLSLSTMSMQQQGISHGQYIDSRLTSPIISPRDLPQPNPHDLSAGLSPRDHMMSSMSSRVLPQSNRDPRGGGGDSSLSLNLNLVSGGDTISISTPRGVGDHAATMLSHRDMLDNPTSMSQQISPRSSHPADGYQYQQQQQQVGDPRMNIQQQHYQQLQQQQHQHQMMMANVPNFSPDELMLRLQAQAQGLVNPNPNNNPNLHYSANATPGQRSTGSSTPNGFHGIPFSQLAASPGHLSVGSLSPRLGMGDQDGFVSPPNGLVQSIAQQQYHQQQQAMYHQQQHASHQSQYQAAAQQQHEPAASYASRALSTTVTSGGGLAPPSFAVSQQQQFQHQQLLQQHISHGHTTSLHIVDPLEMIPLPPPPPPSLTLALPPHHQIGVGSVAGTTGGVAPPHIAAGLHSRLVSAAAAGGQSPSGSPKTFRHKHALHLQCPPALRDRSISDVNSLVFEMAESVLDAASPAVSRTATPAAPGGGLQASHPSDSSLSSDPLTRALQRMSSTDSMGSISSLGSQHQTTSLLFSGSIHGSSVHTSSVAHLNGMVPSVHSQQQQQQNLFVTNAGLSSDAPGSMAIKVASSSLGSEGDNAAINGYSFDYDRDDDVSVASSHVHAADIHYTGSERLAALIHSKMSM